jgi:hypothetical protein
MRKAQVVSLLVQVLACVYLLALGIEIILIKTGHLTMSPTGADSPQALTFGLPFPFSLLLGIAIVLVFVVLIWSFERGYRQSRQHTVAMAGPVTKNPDVEEGPASSTEIKASKGVPPSLQASGERVRIPQIFISHNSALL